jgi:hypothetical protein
MHYSSVPIRAAGKAFCGAYQTAASTESRRLLNSDAKKFVMQIVTLTFGF